MVGGAVIPAVRGGRKIKEGGEGEGGEIVGIVSVCVEVRGKKTKNEGKKSKRPLRFGFVFAGRESLASDLGRKRKKSGPGSPKVFLAAEQFDLQAGV